MKRLFEVEFDIDVAERQFTTVGSTLCYTPLLNCTKTGHCSVGVEVKSMSLELVGLRHVAVWVQDVDRSVAFYRDVLGMKLEWMPDRDNAYLTSGSDNLALHRRPQDQEARSGRVLDHIGFAVARPEDVDEWAQVLRDQGVEIAKEPKTHRDGSRSFYVYDPDRILIQLIYHAPISGVS